MDALWLCVKVNGVVCDIAWLIALVNRCARDSRSNEWHFAIFSDKFYSCAARSPPMTATNAITVSMMPPAESARHNDARAPRVGPTIIDVEPAVEHTTSEQASRVYRSAAEARGRDYGLPARVPRPRARDQETTSLGFTAQRIAQEELSEGLYFENFRPAIAAYAAADSNFATVRRPPLSSIVVWA